MKIQDYLYSEFDESIVEEFLMLLDVMEDNLDLAIERLYSDYEEAINDIFRMFHNFKSASGYLKIKRLENFAHFVEGILDRARKKDKASEELIDWLFKVSDQFHKWYKEINDNLELSPINPDILKSIPKI
jgi:two-component system chemotaxis sensor kinase CheA